MNYIYALDWLINKPIRIYLNEDLKFNYWDKIIYIEKNDPSKKKMIWSYIWYECASLKDWEYVWKLEWDEKEKFIENQNNSTEIFKIFKKKFKKHFEDSIPIIWRMNYYNDLIYLYFYSEIRYNFWNFLQELKKEIKINFFLYQVWARDRIRLSPDNCCVFWSCWKILCCKKDQTPLPSVENFNIELQNLYYKWIEKLKWKCWKLKCCLNYEKDIYEEEWKKYPEKWKKFKFRWDEFECIWINILTSEILSKNCENNELTKINLNDLKQKI